MPNHFDAIIVGAGQAGPSLAARLAGAGQKVALIEKGYLGGTCVNVGCTPTKAWVANARAIQQVRRGEEMGFSASATKIDMARIKARKDGVVLQSRSGLERWLGAMEGLSLIKGTAEFASPNSLRVADEVYEADKIFLNVGARPSVPDFDGVDTVPYLNSSSILDLDTLPEHLIVVGGSYVGLEFAQIFRRFGSRVTIVERGARLVAHEDDDVSQAVAEVMRSEGIELRLNAECIRLEHNGSAPMVHVSCEDGSPVIVGSHVLLAVGRTVNTDLLKLENAGLTADSHGYISVDDQLRTAVNSIWALGDCNGHGGFTHSSYNDFEIVADNLLDGGSRRVSDRIQAHALYIDPPLGQVGLTERQVRKQGVEALMATRPMSRVSRAFEKGETQGFMKVLVEKASGRILGGGPKETRRFTASSAPCIRRAITRCCSMRCTFIRLFPS